MAIIDCNFCLRIEAVDQVTTPGVRSEDGAMQIMASEVIYGTGWEAGAVEVRVHQLLRSERAAMKSNPAGKSEHQDGPDVSAESCLDVLHSPKKWRRC